MQEKSSGASSWLSEKANGAVNFVQQKSSAGLSWLSEKANGAVNFVQEKGSGAVNWLQEKGSAIGSFVKEKGSGAVNWLQEKGSGVGNWLKEKGSQAWNGVQRLGELGKNALQWAGDGVKAGWEWTKNKASDFGNWATEKVSQGLAWANENILQPSMSWLGDKWAGVKGWLGEHYPAISKWGHIILDWVGLAAPFVGAIGGGIVGGIAGLAAGGVGAIPGAIAGASAGWAAGEVVSTIADGINTGWYLGESGYYASQGDETKAQEALQDAGWASIGLIPVVGNVLGKGGKRLAQTGVGRWGGKALDWARGGVKRGADWLSNTPAARRGGEALDWAGEGVKRGADWLSNTPAGQRGKQFLDWGSQKADQTAKWWGQQQELAEQAAKQWNLSGGKPPTPRPDAPGRTVHFDVPEVEPGVVAKASAVDGHQIKVLSDGRVVRCSTCGELRNIYAKELANHSELTKELERIEKIPNEITKAREATKLESKLHALASKTARANNPSSKIIDESLSGLRERNPNKLTDIAPPGSKNVLAGDPLPQRIYDTDGSLIPLGFKSLDDYKVFTVDLNQGLLQAGFNDVTPIFQGSSVTGFKGFDKITKGKLNKSAGNIFDTKASDFDIALCSPKLLEKAKEVVGNRIITGQGKRTFELDNNALRKLGLIEMRDKLSNQAGRPVNFVIFDSVPRAMNKKDAFSIVP